MTHVDVRRGGKGHPMADEDPITFPDDPRLELEQTLGQLIGQAHRVLTTQGRLRALIRANHAVVSNLDLPHVLRTIVEAAVDLVSARYGALGVLGDDGRLGEFIHVGMSDADIARIGRLPRGLGLVGALIDEPRPIRVDSIAADPRSVGFPEGHPEMTAFLGVPIRVHDTVYGNLYLTDPASGRFSDDDEQLVTALATSAGFAIANARLYAETAARQAWAAALTQVTAGILGETAAAPDAIATALRPLNRSHAVYVLAYDAVDDTLRVDAAGGDDEVPARLPPGNPRIRSVLEGRQPRRVAELGPFPATAVRGPAILVPFTAGDDRQRLVVAVREAGSPAFTDFELERTVAFVQQAAFAAELLAARAQQSRMALSEDRARIARDLHDQVIQQLFGAGLELQSVQAALGPGAVAARVDRTVTDIDDAIRQIRTVIFALSHDDADAGLRHRILDVVQDAGAALAHPATVSFAGPVDVVCTPRVADDVLAFVREALTNVVRHAGASGATIAVTASADDIVATVADDGTGIGDAPRRSGLANLAERARRGGGRLDVASTSAGTTLRLQVPLTHPSPTEAAR